MIGTAPRLPNHLFSTKVMSPIFYVLVWCLTFLFVSANASVSHVRGMGVYVSTGLDEFGAEQMSGVCDEILRIKDAVHQKDPEHKLDMVCTVSWV